MLMCLDEECVGVPACSYISGKLWQALTSVGHEHACRRPHCGVCLVASFPRKFFGRRCSMTPLTVELVEPHSLRVIGRRHCLIYILSTTVSKV